MLNKKKINNKQTKFNNKTKNKKKERKPPPKNNLQMHQVWSDKYSVLEYKWFLVLMKILAETSILILLIVAWCSIENKIDSLPGKDTYWTKLSPLLLLIFHWSGRTLQAFDDLQLNFEI